LWVAIDAGHADAADELPVRDDPVRHLACAEDPVERMPPALTGRVADALRMRPIVGELLCR